MTDPNFTRHDGSSVGEIISTVVVPLYESSHGDVIDQPFYTTDRFLERLDGYRRAPGFELVAAYVDAQPVGQAFGYTLPAGARWWQGLITEVPDELIHETGQRTFAVNEIMVHPTWQRRGIARRLHDELTGARPEERSTLLVRADNEPARAAYDRWGYTTIGKLQPFADSPVFDAMILPTDTR